MEPIGGFLLVALVLLALLLAVLWILMPFAIFGTKDVLRAMLKEQKRTNEILIAEARRVRSRDGDKPDDDLTATR